MRFELPKLNYSYDSLEPYIDSNYGNSLYEVSCNVCE